MTTNCLKKHTNRLEIKTITAVSYFNTESHSSAALCDHKEMLCYAKVLPVYIE